MDTYTPKKPCKRGHSERHVKSRGCVECNRLGASSWAAKNPASVALRKARWRAKRAGVPFDLTTADVSTDGRCPVLGTTMTRGSVDNAPTIDRRIPELGYVRGNVAVISSKANRIKNDATLEELKRVVSWLELDTSTRRV